MNPLDIATDQPPAFLEMTVDTPNHIASMSARFCRLRVINRDAAMHWMEKGSMSGWWSRRQQPWSVGR